VKIFVVCSSKKDIDNIYFEKFKEIFELLKNHTLVFGGYDSGIMGLAYHTFSKVIGIAQDVFKDSLDELDCIKKVFPYTGEATDNMILESDVILVLPGGIGSLHELALAIHMKSIGEIDKKIIIYNIDNYYDDLLSYMNKMINNKFMDENINDLFEVVDTQKELIKRLY